MATCISVKINFEFIHVNTCTQKKRLFLHLQNWHFILLDIISVGSVGYPFRHRYSRLEYRYLTANAMINKFKISL